MPEKKRQHYIPKSYMKAFANEKKMFAVFNLNSKKIYCPVPYESQCYGDYFYGEEEFSHFRVQAFQDRDRNRRTDKVNTLGPEGHKIMMTSLRKTICDCSFSFGKVQSDFAAVPICCREAVPREREEKWENKLRNAGKIMVEISKLPNTPLKSSGLPRKEHYRGRNKMLRCALKYWSE